MNKHLQKKTLTLFRFQVKDTKIPDIFYKILKFIGMSWASVITQKNFTGSNYLDVDSPLSAMSHVTCHMSHVTSFMSQVTCDMWYETHPMWRMTCDMWQVIHDMWHVTCNMWHVTCVVGCFRYFFVHFIQFFWFTFEEKTSWFFSSKLNKQIW